MLSVKHSTLHAYVYYIPSPNQQKTIRPTDEEIMKKVNDDETYDDTYDKN